MALRTLDGEEKAFLDKQIRELSSLHSDARFNNIEAYHYEWLHLSAKLEGIINFYKHIIEKDAENRKHRQYSAYLSNGGTMSMEEWEADGRWDKSLIE